jgi:predicted metal-dependent hydrolase
MLEKQVHHKEIGDISLKKTRKAHNLRITVKPGKNVTVTVPLLVSWTEALKFVEIKKDWILESMEKMKDQNPGPTVFSPGVSFRTRDHVLIFEPILGAEMKAKIFEGKIVIYYPAIEMIYSRNGQSLIHQAVIFALRREAKKYLPERVKILAQQHGFSYKNVFVKDLKSRWGSCSSVNNINLNIHLVRLPEKLTDYVILHELVHTVHKNHGKHFWEMLNQITGNAKLLAKEMKKYRTQVY